MKLFPKYKIVLTFYNNKNEAYVIKKRYCFIFYKYIRSKEKNKYNWFLGYKFTTSLEGANAYINNEMKKL